MEIHRQRFAAGGLSGRIRETGPPHALLHGHRPEPHQLRISPASAQNTRHDDHGELLLQRSRHDGPPADRDGRDTRHRHLLRTMAQTARHARVPPHGSVRQRQPFDGEGLRLSVRTAGTAARHGTPAFLVHRRRCGDGRNADVLLRERAAAVIHHALPCAGRRNTAQPESRQMVLRFLQGLRTEPLRTRIPTRFLCRQAIRRIHRSEHHALHLRLPDTHLHHAARAEQILRHLHAAALPGDLFLPQRTCGTRCPTRATVRAWYRRR